MLRRVDVDNIYAGAVASNNPTASQGGDRLRAHRRILRDDGVGVSGNIDHIIRTFAMSGDQLEASALDNRALDLDVTKVIVGNDNGRPSRCTHRASPFLERCYVIEAPSDALRATRS